MVSETFLPSRMMHSSASCWRVMIWPLTMMMGSLGFTGIWSYEREHGGFDVIEPNRLLGRGRAGRIGRSRRRRRQFVFLVGIILRYRWAGRAEEGGGHGEPIEP